MNWGTYNRILTLNGSSDKEIDLTIAKEDFEIYAPSHIGYQSDCTRNGVTQRFLVDKTESQYKNIFTAFPNEELNIGDVIFCRGQHFIIVTPPRVSNEVTASCTGWLCNYLLRFQNSSSETIERWCVFDSGQYSTVLTEDNTISYLNKQYRLYLPYDDDTKKIYIDKRFAFDIRYDRFGEKLLEVYQVTGTNRTTYNYGTNSHLLTLDLRSDSYNKEKDNIDLMICDYIDTNEDSHLTEYQIIGKDIIKLGSNKNYAIALNNQVVEDINDLHWKYDIVGGITFTVDNNKLNISVSDDDNLIGQVVVISITDDNNNILCSKKIEVVAV